MGFMEQSQKALTFAALHKKGAPVVLYNIWDAGSAKSVAATGASAIATGSHAVAGAQGYNDGEALPLDLLLTIVERIATVTELPVSVDFEGGFAIDPDAICENVSKVISAGAIGINFEDQIVGGGGLYSISDQQKRLAAAVKAGHEASIPLFVNARTDLFLKEPDGNNHRSLIDAALAREDAYRAAGASSFFVPGLADPDLIKAVCDSAILPVNVMMKPDMPTSQVLAELGVARISYGPFPFIDAMKTLGEYASQVLV